MQQGEGEKPKRSLAAARPKSEDVTLEKALALLSLPREVARHPTSGEPILAGIGRYGAYVQHGKTYANLGRDDDVLEIGANRAIDLIVAKESGAGASRFGGGGTGRVLGEHPEGGPVSVKQGRFGAYVNHGKINATIPKGTDPASLTLDDALALLEGQSHGRRRLRTPPRPASARRAGHRARGPLRRLTSTGARSTRPSPSRRRPDSISLDEALELIAEREGKPAPSARKAPAKAAARKAPAKSASQKSASAKGAPRKAMAAAAKRPAAKAKPKAAVKKR